MCDNDQRTKKRKDDVIPTRNRRSGSEAIVGGMWMNRQR